MVHQSFSIRQTLKYGFKKIYDHLGFLFGLLLIQVAISVGIALLYNVVAVMLTPYIEQAGISFYENIFQVPLTVSLPLILLRLLTIACEMLFFVTTIRIFLDIHDSGSSSYNEFFHIKKFIIPYIVASIFFGIFGAIGLVALIVPGLIVITMLNFYDIIIVDQGCGGIEALKISQKMTQGLRLKLFLFIAICAILSGITFGLLYPVVLMARIDLYKKLKAAHSWL